MADFVTCLLLLLFRCVSYLVCSQAGFYAERFPMVWGGGVKYEAAAVCASSTAEADKHKNMNISLHV